jgi:hypothetical protein
MRRFRFGDRLLLLLLLWEGDVRDDDVAAAAVREAVAAVIVVVDDDVAAACLVDEEDVAGTDLWLALLLLLRAPFSLRRSLPLAAVVVVVPLSTTPTTGDSGSPFLRLTVNVLGLLSV